MTDAQINAAIDRVTGCDGNECRCDDCHPDWCNDLNAMHKAEKTILDINDGYGWELSRTECFTVWHATARQRAEAFLRTLGKWEEGK